MWGTGVGSGRFAPLEGLPLMMRRLSTIGWRLINIAQALVLVVWTVLAISLAFFVLFVTFNRDLGLRLARTLWAPVVLRCAGARVVVDGLKNVDWSQPTIFMMNHRSLIDIPVAMSALPTPLRFIAKDSLKHIPFLGWFIASTGMVFLGRKNKALPLSGLRKATTLVSSGHSLLVFPEGTRSRNDSLLPFRKGSFAMALRTGVPVTPVVVLGASEVLPPDTFRVRPGLIQVRIGPPVRPGSPAPRRGSITPNSI